MAKNVVAKVTGGSPQQVASVDTIECLRLKMKLDASYKATVHGEPQDDDYVLNDDDYVIFAPAVKGGRA